MFNQLNQSSQGDKMQTLQELFTYTKKEITSLLEAYLKYKNLSQQINSGTVTEETKPKFSLFKNSGKMQNLDPLAKAKKELDQIGESMKFQNPLIWIGYKYQAYQNEPGKTLNTLYEIREHCKVDGICFRRFDAINSYLRRKNNGKDLNSQDFLNGETSLEEVSQDSRFISMCQDKDFMRLWTENENDKAGKWKNYKLVSPDHDCEINCSC